MNPTLSDFLAGLSPEARQRVIAANPGLQPARPTAIEPAPKPDKPKARAGEYKSLLEQRYAAHLDGLLAAHEIAEWRYESVAFKLSRPGQPACRYTPDFYVRFPDDRIELHETKGWLREDARLKLLWIGQQLPPAWRLAVVTWDRESCGWKYDFGFCAEKRAGSTGI